MGWGGVGWVGGGGWEGINLFFFVCLGVFWFAGSVCVCVCVFVLFL